VVFSSHLFVFGFLPLALAFYYASPRRYRHLVLTIASYVFYGWGNPSFLALLLLSTAIDWYAGLVQATEAIWPFRKSLKPLEPWTTRSSIQRAALISSVVSNLSLLGFFKYFNFLVDSWNGLAHTFGFDAAILRTALQVTLPLGISFYTFQSMSYSIDVYRGRAVPMRSFVDFACFVSMFPQLVAGPIIRFSEVADQLRERTHTATKFARGIVFFSIGIGKKVLLANPCGRIADTVFESASTSIHDAWYGLVAYAFQIYFDFSGYSDMAIGLGLMLGFVFPRNFDSPYRSRSITEFWQRWHLSLSTWLRDYLYIPLGGNRRGERRTYVNLFLVMLLGGLWHGAAWNFVAWGALHGGLLAAERAAGGPDRLWRWIPAQLRVAWTFLLVALTWVPFRARDLSAAGRFAASLAGSYNATPPSALVSGVVWVPYLTATFVLAGIVVWACPQTWFWSRDLKAYKAVAAAGVLALSLLVLTTQRFNPFLYFIF